MVGQGSVVRRAENVAGSVSDFRLRAVLQCRVGGASCVLRRFRRTGAFSLRNRSRLTAFPLRLWFYLEMCDFVVVLESRSSVVCRPVYDIVFSNRGSDEFPPLWLS